VCRLVGCQDLLSDTPSQLNSHRDSSTLSPMSSRTLDRRPKTSRSISRHDFKSDGSITDCLYPVFVVSHADGGRVARVSATFISLFVCLSVLPHDISKTGTARITELDTEVFQHES